MASIFVKNQTQASSSQNMESFLSRFALYVNLREIPWKHHACKRSCRPTHKQTPSESRTAAAAMTFERFAGWGGLRRRIRSESARPSPQPTHRLRFASKIRAFLHIHGLLHLLGFDHENSEEAEVEMEKEEELL
ncbi:hypothetical protein C1H46_010247 [Malus baccata]|uniref:rRNA maturation RNase YbeY n=1 Tax=Malus baccata TaxID=106549 RepID=A0A540MZA1_MALBA|nr:hypothetical protein C1H46_010247 [Malus baccata]